MMRGFKLLGLLHSQVVLSAHRTPLLSSTQRARCVYQPPHRQSPKAVTREWIEIPVPALVTEESFALAQELLYQNKIRSRRIWRSSSSARGT